MLIRDDCIGMEVSAFCGAQEAGLSRSRGVFLHCNCTIEDSDDRSVVY